jgi:hypothetical protein
VTATLMAENKATPSATTLGVVKIAPPASPSNKLGINQPNGLNLLEKCERHREQPSKVTTEVDSYKA